MRNSTALLLGLLGCSTACGPEAVTTLTVEPATAQTANALRSENARRSASAGLTGGLSKLAHARGAGATDAPAVPTSLDEPTPGAQPSGPAATRVVSGNVVGLVGGGLTLRNNGGDDLALSTDGAFAFAVEVQDGAPYAITIAGQPTAPWQTCVVVRGEGVVAGAPITDVSVSCALDSYKVGGTVSGLTGTLVLTNHGGDALSVTTDGAFQFATAVESGSYYDVRIATQPAGQHCRVEAGGDIIDGADSNWVVVTCATTECVSLGWKLGGADWTCPAGYRMPTKSELARVTPCVDAVDEGRFTAYADIAVSVGGCGCGWNPTFCSAPSVQTMRTVQACGDYEQLHICVAE